MNQETPRQVAKRADPRPVDPESGVAHSKAHGITYTPPSLADFVAREMLEAYGRPVNDKAVRILDPALGRGELAVSLLKALSSHNRSSITLHGYDTDATALAIATDHITTRFPKANLRLRHASFLDDAHVSRKSSGGDLFAKPGLGRAYDLIIANPPYVRTQVLGANVSRALARDWGLTGRVDLYYAFLLAMAEVLAPDGVAGVIVSNRFMTTRSGTTVRKALSKQFEIKRLWDLGDTKLFDAAVLPAVFILGRKNGTSAHSPDFTSIYETDDAAQQQAPTPLHALSHSGVVGTPDGRRFRVRHGVLQQSSDTASVWHVTTPSTNAWLATVADHTWATLGSVGRVRVGIKTCADAVFVRDDWHTMPASECPELLRPLITHKVARRYRSISDALRTKVLYPHEVVEGRRRAVDLNDYPRTAAYLAKHRAKLERREYLMKSGRRWYEIWVPQDPLAWRRDKLVFRDISADPTFWVDRDGMVVNGDCYWWTPTHVDEDLLWLAAAVGNSTFIGRFYDRCFNNRLYAGRRRFMAQYVKDFPLPDPKSGIAREISEAVHSLYHEIKLTESGRLQRQIDNLVFESFGLKR